MVILKCKFFLLPRATIKLVSGNIGLQITLCQMRQQALLMHPSNFWANYENQKFRDTAQLNQAQKLTNVQFYGKS